MSTQIPPTVATQALEWLVELQSDEPSTELLERCEQWRNAHPDHERAWQRIQQVNSRLQQVASPIAHATITPPSSPQRGRSLKAFAVFFIGLAVAALSSHSHWAFLLADYRTGEYEQREVTLADGTHVALNKDSAMDVNIDGHRRELRLVRGEMLVITGHDPQMSPGNLRVATASGDVEALGTQFGIRDDGDGSVVHVYDGVVLIRSRDASTESRLHAGQTARFTEHGIDSLADRASSTNAAMLVASNMRLADFVERLNEHFFGRIDCDPAVADLRVSGTYPAQDVDTILDVLATTLPIQRAGPTRYWVRLESTNKH